MTRCDKCGAAYMQEFERDGSPIVDCRCAACGNETWILVDDGTYALDGSLRSTDPCFRLAGHWSGKPSVQQVVDVQLLFPQLKVAGFSALWRRAVAHEEIKFGSYTQEHVSYLASVLHELGLETSQSADPLSVKPG
jgi:hypothetical protein